MKLKLHSSTFPGKKEVSCSSCVQCENQVRQDEDFQISDSLSIHFNKNTLESSIGQYCGRWFEFLILDLRNWTFFFFFMDIV